MTFEVKFSPEGKAQLRRLYKFQLDRSEYLEDLEVSERALEAIEVAAASLGVNPFLYRRIAGRRSSLRRELVVPFGADGYVIQYEIAGPALIIVVGVRHQREQDYH